MKIGSPVHPFDLLIKRFRVNAKILIFFGVMFLYGCIGTDYQEDPIVGERIEILQEQVALKPTQMHELNALYFDKYGQQQSVTFTWLSTETSIATVDQNGKVTAHKAGQAMVTASFAGAQSEPINVNVVVDENDVAFVEVSSPGEKNSLAVGEGLQLSAVVKNFNGTVLTGRTVEWFSENSSIATVTAEGKITAVSGGVVDIHAKVEGIKSNILRFTVSGGRAGTFVSAGGYQAIGTATLKTENGNLILQLSEDFKTSFALGTFVYLANSTNGAQVKSGGLEIAQITNNGAKTFNVTAISANTGINDYRYVIILCKPASVTFGYADLN